MKPKLIFYLCFLLIIYLNQIIPLNSGSIAWAATFPISTNFCQQVNEIPLNQCQTLIELYNRTEGKNWQGMSNNSWGMTNTPCKWTGITCRGGNVTEINLNGKNLVGSLPDLSALTHLQVLLLYNNPLTGFIPDLSALRYLDKLTLPYRQLQVAFPIPEAFCQKITTLSQEQCQTLVDLYNNTNGKHWKNTPNNNWGITGLPCHWQGVQCRNHRVTVIKLDRNNLNGSLIDLKALTHLEELDLSNNQLTGIIPDLSTLTHLEQLDLSTNQLSGSIPDLSALSNLQTLNLSSNQLNGVIPDLTLLTHLESFKVFGNQLSGLIPDTSTLTDLRELVLFRGYQIKNQLDIKIYPIPETFCQQVTEISIAQCQALINLYNHTDGTNWKNTPINYWGVTLEPCKWTGIQCRGKQVAEIKLDNNNLRGTIPDLSALTHLERLDLSSNQLTGSIPDLSTLTHLEQLNLSKNQLTGSLPDLSQLIDLQQLELKGNQLTVTFPIPDTFCTQVVEISKPQCQTLVNLYNHTQGQSWEDTPANNWGIMFTPCHWRGIRCEGRYVTEIKLRQRGLSGTLPDLSALNYLEELDLSNNQLSGSLPDLAALVELERLNLSHNRLTGTIPDLKTLTRLEKIDLSYNQLSGVIPELTTLSHLENFSSRHNQLQTRFPISETFCEHVTEISPAQCQVLVNLYNHTQGNQWDMSYENWGITTTPCHWQGITCESGKVTKISLARKNLKGILPDLSALIYLQSLELSNNQLQGSLSKLATLNQLERLDLSHNQFSGTIADLSIFTRLKHLELSHNQFTGAIPDLSQLIRLETLDLSQNQLSGVFPDLSTLSRLKVLLLAGNQLQVRFPIPVTFCNSVTEIPLAQCQTLVAFYNSTQGKDWKDTPDNQWGITNTPCRWQGIHCQGKQINRITRRKQNLSGTLPALTALTALEGLNLAYNQLKGTIPNLNALNYLEGIDLSYNQFSGSWPDLSKLTNLRKIDLTGNSLKANFPISNTFCQNVTEIPEDQCQTLVNLYNNTQGHQWKAISASQWGLTNTPCHWEGVQCHGRYVISIQLSNRNLTGILPNLSALTRLKQLHLSNNQLQGPIPNLSSLIQLRQLQLSNNQLNGSIPDLSTLTRLEELDLSSNQLSGLIPDLRVLPQLQKIKLSNNALEVLFPIPTTFCQEMTVLPKTQCQTLVTFYNHTNGKEWRDTPVNQWGIISNPCQWEGVTCEGGNVVSLVRRNQKLTGSLPDLSALTGLETLNLSQNQLGNSIPDLSSLIYLKSLNLSKNQFTGAIPELSTLIHLNDLNLSDNQLRGAIPDLSSLTQLRSISLVNNQLDLSTLNLNQLTPSNPHILTNSQPTKPPFPIPETFCSKVTEIPNNQCQTLVNLYNNTQGQMWEEASHSKWGVIKMPCQWVGIHCQAGNVTEIILNNNKLKGTLPDLSALNHLEKLNLSDNQLSGSIPNLSKLTHLKWLYLCNNQLSGSIPDLSALRQLRWVRLSNNQLTGSLPDLNNLPHLQHFSFSNNKIKGVLPDLSNRRNPEEPTQKNRPPKAITEIFIRRTGLNSAILEWEPPPSAYQIARYLIFYNINYSGYPYTGRGLKQGHSPITVNGKINEFVLHDLPTSELLYFVVVAVNEYDQQGPMGKEIKFTIGDDKHPPIESDSQTN